MKRIALFLAAALALSAAAASLGESFPAAETFPQAESLPAAEAYPAAEPAETANPYPEADLPQQDPNVVLPATDIFGNPIETAAPAAGEGVPSSIINEEAATQEEAAPAADAPEALLSVEPLGNEEIERLYAGDLARWSGTALSVLATDGGALLLDSATPVYTLVSAAARETADPQYAAAPGTAEGLNRAAGLLLGEMSAYGQSVSLDFSAVKPFRAGFAPQHFTIGLVQAAAGADGSVSMDCGMLSLTDAGGGRQEGPSYVFVRFFRGANTVCWLSNDLQMLQVLAQTNTIRASSGAGLALSATAPPEEAPDWGGLVKSAQNGLAYNPEIAYLVTPTPAPVAAVDFFPADTAAAPLAPTPTPGIQYVSIKAGVSGASVRESPTTSSKRVALAKPGIDYEFLGVTEYGWITIRLPDGMYGYVNSKLVGPLPGEETGRRITVTKSTTIHEEPTYYSNEPSSVSAGRSYYVVNDRIEEWVQIRTGDGAIGYVNRKIVR